MKDTVFITRGQFNIVTGHLLLLMQTTSSLKRFLKNLLYRVTVVKRVTKLL